MQTRSLFLLQTHDEMRHPYHSALEALGFKPLWFTALSDLLAASRKQEPALLIVDLDVLLPPLEPTLEQLRTIFASSDLIALSSSDSAQLATHCLRLGFIDFLLKPASPEELAWSVRRSQQRQDVFDKLREDKIDLLRTISRIASVTTPALVRLTVLEFLHQWFGSEGACWISSETNAAVGSQLLAAVPKRADAASLLTRFPWKERKGNKVTILRAKKGKERSGLLLPCKDRREETVYLWGISERVTRKRLWTAQLLLEQGELSLHNLRKYEQIKQQTFVDDLTGLYNSRYLKFALTNAVLKSTQRGKHFSVLFIDVDHFKRINDTHGHLVGSEFLVAIGKTIRHAVRGIDPVFRYGGDEFVVLLQDTTAQGACEIAERIRKSIERRIFVIQRQRIQATVSIGIAAYPDHAQDKEDLLKLADEAMYAAKKEQRNCVHLAV